MRTLDISVQDRASRTAAEWLWPLVPIGAAVFCLSALIYFRVQYEVVQVRSAMQVMIAGIYQAIGFAPAVMFFLLLLTWSSIWFVTGRLDRPLMRVGRLLAMAVMMGVFLNLGDGGVAAAAHKGVVGAWLAGCLVGAIGYYPSIVLVWAVTFAALLLATDFFFSDSFERLRQRPRSEVGVETSVTDHLRGLGALAAVAESAPRPSAAGRDATAAMAATGAPELDFLRELQADESPLAGTADVDGEDADGERAFTPRRRRSYFDRRRADDDVDPAVGFADEFADEPADVDVTTAAEWAPGPAETGPAETGPAETGPAETGIAAIAAAAVEPPLAADSEPAASEPAASEPVAAEEEPAEETDTWLRDEEPELASTPQQSFVAIEETLPSPIEHELTAADRAIETDDDDEADEADDEVEIEPEVGIEAELAEPIAAVGPEAAGSTDAADGDAADGDAADGDAADGDAADDESTVAIPRPDQAAREWQAPTAPRIPPRPQESPVRQQKLFAAEVDEELLQEALEVVGGQSRVTAVLLQRRLRIDYQQAMDVLRELGARGVLELDADASQGRVVV